LGPRSFEANSRVSCGELKNAATGETEGGTTLTEAPYRPARAILRKPAIQGPHSLRMQTVASQNKGKIPPISLE